MIFSSSYPARRKLRRNLLLSGSAGLALSASSAHAQNSPAKPGGPSLGLAPAPVYAAPSAARIAIERARQLEAQGIPTLAAVQYREAVTQAPTSLEAARQLARFYSRQKRYAEATQAWRQVLTLKRGDAEATTQYALVRNRTTQSLAQSKPRLAQNPAPITTPSTTPDTPPITAPLTAPDAAPVAAPVAAPDTAQPTVPASTAPEGTPIIPAPDAPANDVPLTSPDTAAAPIRVPVPRAVASPPRVLPRTPARVAAAPAAQTTPIRFIAPAKVTRRVSKIAAANAFPLVNRAARELTAGRAQSALTLYQRAFKLDPNNPYAGPGIGTSNIVLGRFDAAASAFRQVLALKPGDPKALRGLADALTFGRKYREALGVNNAILNSDSRNFAAALQGGEVSTYLGAYTQSDRYFQTATTLEPDSAAARVAWGESLSYRRDPRARANFERALKVAPGNPRALAGLGNFHAYSGQFGQAVPLLRRALVAKPGDTALQISLADALTNSGKYADATPIYRAVLAKQAGSVPARLGLGRALVYSGQNEAGATQLLRVLSAQPGNAAALEALAIAQSDFAPGAAIESYQTLLSRQKTPAARANILATIGDLSARDNNFARAIESYSQAQRLAPNDPKISFRYVQLLSSQERYAEARPVLEGVLTRQPDNIQALALQVLLENNSGNTALAKTLATSLEDRVPAGVDEALSLAEALRATGNAASAKRVLERAVGTATTPANALRLADATLDAGDYAGAASLYQAILAKDASNIPARLSLSRALLYQRDFVSAQEQVNRVLALEPGNIEAKVTAGEISLRGDTTASRERAEEQAREVLATDPNNAGAKNILGEVLTSRQQFAEAITQFRGAVDARPNDLQARVGLARNLYYSRDVEGAITEYREVIRRLPTETLPRLELGQIFLDRNRFSEAEALFNEVLAIRGGLPLNTASLSVETRAYAKLNPLAMLNSPLKAKLAKTRRVIVNAPGKALGGGRILLAQVGAGGGTAAPIGSSGATSAPLSGDAMGTTTTAPDATAPATVTTPATPDANIAPATPEIPSITPAPDATAALNRDPALSDQLASLRGLGEIRRRQNRFAESLAFFNQALALDSSDSAARVGVAQALRGQGQFAPALEQADQVLATDGANLPARVLRAQLLGDTNQPEAAQRELDALVSSLPQNAPLETYLTLAQAFNSLRNFPASLQLLDEAAADFPTEPAVPRLRAETLTFARRTPEAVAIYDTLITADPNDADAILGKARAYNYTNQLDLAEPTYRQALSVQPANFQAQTELADVLGRRSNFAESIALYQTAVAANPTDLNAPVELARVQRISGASSDAEATLNTVLERDPRAVPALIERGLLRGSLGSYAPAIADLNAALEVSPTDLDAQLGLAEVQSYAGNYPASIAGFRAALVRDPQNLRARTQLGLALSYNNQNAEALTELDAAIAQTPNDVDARLAKADVLGRANRTSDAVELYNAILVSEPNNVRARTGLADTYLYGRQYSNAISVYDSLIAQNPSNLTFRIQRARALGYNGRAREAVSELRSIVQTDPANVSARLALAEAGTNSGDPNLVRDAVADYRNILVGDSANVPAQVGLARALSYSGKFGEAASGLNSVLTANPENTEARLALAETQRFAGDSFGARSNYDQVLQTQPNNQTARRGRRVVVRNTSPRLSLGGSYYNDTNGVNLRSLNYGGFLPTKAGTIGVLAERGRFSQNGGPERDRNAISLLLERAFGPTQARLVLTRLKYDGAPNRTLFDLLLNNVKSPRQRTYLNFARRDIFESDTAVVQGITATFLRAGLTKPLGSKFDFEGQITRYRYSDDNDRTSIQPSILYRFRPNNPSLRVGLGYFYDNTDERRDQPTFIYYTPQGFNATSILADYVVDQGGPTRYGLFAAYPLTGETGQNGINRPAKTLFGFFNRDLNDALELFAQGGIVRSPDFRSNQINGGVNFRFN